jgi:CheY-like chemotaxis protein
MPDPLHRRRVTILMAEDDEDDRLMARDALAEGRVTSDLRFVADGEELLQYLRHEGPYADGASAPRPALILLDLNMPKVDGREALAAIKGDPALRAIPVVILTTSKAEEDVQRAYDLGVNSFITKPVTFARLVETMTTFAAYWLDTVDLPASVQS